VSADAEFFSKKMAEKVKEVSGKVEDFVTEELKELLDELRTE